MIVLVLNIREKFVIIEREIVVGMIESVNLIFINYKFIINYFI